MTGVQTCALPISIAEIVDNLSGIAELKSISAKKPHWTIFAEIAKLHNKVSDKDNALLNYFRAAITMEPSKMKVTLYYDIYKLLYDNDQQEWANLHALFVINIRESEGWSLNNELQQIKDNTKHDENDIKNLERKLRVFWLEKIHCLLNAQNGIITNINKNGKFGFIKGRTKSYYFQRQSVIQNKRINENDKVKFCVIDSFDFKKRQRTEEAAYIILDN